MTYHLYVRPDGYSTVTDFELPLGSGPCVGYTYLGASETRPDVDGKRYINGEWVRELHEPEYVTNRRYGFPPAMDLFNALWKAMDKGDLPKVPGFYDRIDAVYKRFPEK